MSVGAVYQDISELLDQYLESFGMPPVRGRLRRMGQFMGFGGHNTDLLTGKSGEMRQ